MASDIEQLFELSLDMLCIASIDGYFKQVNPAFERTLGWPTHKLLSHPFIEFVHPQDVELTLQEIKKLADGIPTISFENRYQCADGTYKQLFWTAFPQIETGLLYAVARDMTEFKKSEARFRQAVEASPTTMIMVNSSGMIVFSNTAAEKLFGCKRSDLIGKSVDMFVPNELRLQHAGYRDGFMTAPSVRPMGKGRDLKARRLDGSEVDVEIGLNPIEIEGETFVLSSIVDLTHRKEAEQKILKLASDLKRANRMLAELAVTDSLTGLKNRRGFSEEVQKHLELARRSQRPLSLLLADIDHFKDYNDRFGHPAGDELLKEVAQILRDAARQSDFLGRWGGEEFCIALPETNCDEAIRAAERIRQAVENHPWINRKLTLSIGVSTINFKPGDIRNINDIRSKLIGDADQALHASKESGRNCVTHVRDLNSKSEDLY